MGSKLTELVAKLSEATEKIREFKADLEKGTKKAAGLLRKEAQEGKKILQEIRVETMEVLKSLPTKKREKKAE